MILIDDRTGSCELARYFSKSLVKIVRLEYGDFSFIGNGPDEIPVSIGIERKTLTDLLSSLQTGRFSGHQLPGLLNSYYYVYLIVEGIWRSCPSNGILEILAGNHWQPVSLGSRRWMAREAYGYLNTLAVASGLVVWQTTSPRETALLVTILYRWWQKDWAEHKSHLAMRKSRLRDGEGVSLVKPSLVRRVAAELPGIGWGKSREVERVFRSVEDMVQAEAGDWQRIPGIGKKIAEQAVRELRGED